MSTEEANQPPQQDVIANFATELQEQELEAYERSVRKARNALYWAGGLIFFWEMVSMFRSPGGFDPIVFGIAVVEGGVFIALALWSKKKPYSAIIAGISVFIGIIALSVVINGLLEGGEGVAKALFSGIIVKVVILVNLITPLKDAKELQEKRKNQF